MSLLDWSYVIAGLDPAISPAKGIPASERGNDIVGAQEKSKEGMSNKFATRFHSEPAAAVIPGLTRNLPCTRDAEIGCKQPRSA